MTPPPKPTFRPGIEALESRNLMATQLMASLSGGILKIWGTEAADTITVRNINQQLSVDGIQIGTTAGKVSKVASSQVSQIAVYSYGGNDVIRLDSEKVSGQSAITVPSVINAAGGDDTVYGGQGADTIWAGAGNDKVFGNAGADVVYGEAGNDWLEGGDGNDLINAGDGNDRLYGNGGDDNLLGGVGADYLDGGAGADYFNGGTGFDTFKDDFVMSTPVYNGSSASDVIQQQSYTCQTLAALAAHAGTGANIASQIVYRGTNQYDVKLFRNGVAYWTRVTFDGTWSDSDAAPSRAANLRNLPEFWVLLMQRARLQQYGVTWTKELSRSEWDAANVRSGYRLYDPVDALHNFTGRTAIPYAITRATPQALQTALSQKKAIVATTPNTATGSEILPWHAYTITKVYLEAGAWKVQVYNPWGIDSLSTPPKDGRNDGFLTISWADFTSRFNRYAIS